MTYYMRFRLARGMFWRTNRPPIPWRAVLALLLIAVLFALAGALDYQIAKAQELEALADANKNLAQITLDCMSGAQGFYFNDAKLAFSCGAKL